MAHSRDSKEAVAAVVGARGSTQRVRMVKGGGAWHLR